METKTQKIWRYLVYTSILCYYGLILQSWVAYLNPENMEHVPCCRYWEMCSEKLLDSQYSVENSILSETQVLQLHLFSTTRLPRENFCNTNILPQGQKIKEAERDKDEHTKIWVLWMMCFCSIFTKSPQKGTKPTCAASGATFVQGSKNVFLECKRII